MHPKKIARHQNCDRQYKNNILMKETDGILTQKRWIYALRLHDKKESKAKQTREKDRKNEPKKSRRRVHTQIDMQSSVEMKVVLDWISHAVKNWVNSRHEKWVSSRAHEQFRRWASNYIEKCLRSFSENFRMVNIHFWRVKKRNAYLFPPLSYTF